MFKRINLILRTGVVGERSINDMTLTLIISVLTRTLQIKAHDTQNNTGCMHTLLLLKRFDRLIRRPHAYVKADIVMYVCDECNEC